jgi:hypothetical protein
MVIAQRRLIRMGIWHPRRSSSFGPSSGTLSAGEQSFGNGWDFEFEFQKFKIGFLLFDLYAHVTDQLTWVQLHL